MARALGRTVQLGSHPGGPTTGFLVLAFTASGLRTSGTNWHLVLIAACAAVALIGLAFLVPWHGLAGSAILLLPVGCDGVLAVLRHAQGGSVSGYGPLAALPVVGVALTLGRRSVALMSLTTAGLFGVPIIVFGPPLYPNNGWRGVILWTVVAWIIGAVVHAVVAEQRRQASLARAHARDLDLTQQALSSVAVLSRRLGAVTPSEARQMICDAALEAERGVLATIVEPTVDGSFTISGTAGFSIPDAELHESVRPQASLRAFYTRERVLVTDAETDPMVSQLIVRATGLRSILYEPIFRQDKPVGVLCVGWTEKRLELSARSLALYSSLAAEAAAAIERADLFWRLDQLARTDELTGLPNRRAWDEALVAAIARGERCSIALLDLDHFKRYNDTHGHLAGDDLLQQAATAWKAELRPADLIARYGGEEFAVLLPRCGSSDAETIVSRLCDATPGTTTCSAGIAELDGSAVEPDDLMREADEALYLAKSAGRNRVVAAA